MTPQAVKEIDVIKKRRQAEGTRNSVSPTKKTNVRSVFHSFVTNNDSSDDSDSGSGSDSDSDEVNFSVKRSHVLSTLEKTQQQRTRASWGWRNNENSVGSPHASSVSEAGVLSETSFRCDGNTSALREDAHDVSQPCDSIPIVEDEHEALRIMNMLDSLAVSSLAAVSVGVEDGQEAAETSFQSTSSTASIESMSDSDSTPLPEEQLFEPRSCSLPTHHHHGQRGASVASCGAKRASFASRRRSLQACHLTSDLHFQMQALNLEEEILHDVAEEGDTSTEPQVLPEAPPSAAPSPPQTLVVSLSFEYLGVRDLLQVAPSVCKTWAALSATAYSWKILDVSHKLTNNDGMLSAFPCGQYLAEGGFKTVYKVWNAIRARFEAVSVMDADRVEELGQSDAIGKEIECLFMLSEMVKMGICPNYVNTYQVFRSSCGASSSQWGSAESKKPFGDLTPRMCIEHGQEVQKVAKKGRKTKKEPAAVVTGNFVYTRMELCSFGDLEAMMKGKHSTCPEGVFSIDSVRASMFQMVFSLYAAQDRYSLRHFDLKLLNFLATPFEWDESPDEGEDDAVKDSALLYSLGASSFNVFCRSRMTDGEPLLVKLTDLGTADFQVIRQFGSCLFVVAFHS